MNFGCNCSIDCFFMFIKWKLLSAKSLVASRWVFPTDVHGSNSPSHIVTIEINKKWKLLSTCSLVSALHLICASRWVLHKIEDIQHFLCLVLFWVISTNWNVYICIEVVFFFSFCKRFDVHNSRGLVWWNREFNVWLFTSMLFKFWKLVKLVMWLWSIIISGYD